MYDGGYKAAESWVKFFDKAYHQPRQTGHDIAKECEQIREVLLTLAQVTDEFSSGMSTKKLANSVMDVASNIYKKMKPLSPEEQKYESLKNQRRLESEHVLQNTVITTLQVGRVVVQNIAEKSLRENVADAT